MNIDPKLFRKVSIYRDKNEFEPHSKMNLDPIQ